MGIIHISFCCLIFSITFNTGSSGQSGNSFSYSGPNGVDSWGDIYPKCRGQKQSPIDIGIQRLAAKNNKPLAWKAYDEAISMTLANDGHSAKLSPRWSKNEPVSTEIIPSISGSVLRNTYLLSNIHFHWGPNSSVGSEHTFDGKRLPLEAHLVHYKGRYGSLERALQYKDGIVVAAFFFQIVPEDNEAFQPVVQALQQIQETGSSTVIENLNLGNLFNPLAHGFVSYEGSLTTPPCNEAVTWIISFVKLPISEEQLEEFRKLRNDEQGPITANYRPTQKIGSRRVNFIGNNQKYKIQGD